VSKHSAITPDSFSVAPNLIGLPLASPSRRALAMGIDGVLVAILVQAGGVFLGLTAVFVLLRASRKGEKVGFMRASVRFALRGVAALVLFVLAVQAWDFGRELVTGENDAPESASSDASIGDLDLIFPPNEGLAVATGVTGLIGADEPEEVAEHARSLLESAQRAGATDQQMREARSGFLELMGDDADSASIAALDGAFAAILGEAPPPPATPLDSMQAVIADLRERNDRLDERGDSLEDALEESRESRGVRTYLAGLFDDLGLGFGWAAVYFTAFLAMMNGRTPGKRLFGVRVIRLDGRPLGWWISFERFGGYAASFSVGLLGFFQILWDKNRQGLHDKACETVVIRAE
jgi:hypothetical protein